MSGSRHLIKWRVALFLNSTLRYNNLWREMIRLSSWSRGFLALKRIIRPLMFYSQNGLNEFQHNESSRKTQRQWPPPAVCVAWIIILYLISYTIYIRFAVVSTGKWSPDRVELSSRGINFAHRPTRSNLDCSAANLACRVITIYHSRFRVYIIHVWRALKLCHRRRRAL